MTKQEKSVCGNVQEISLNQLSAVLRGRCGPLGPRDRVRLPFLSVSLATGPHSTYKGLGEVGSLTDTRG